MSAYDPKKGSDPGGGAGRWYLGALLLHAAGLAALVWLTPLRDLVSEAAPEASPARRMSDRELGEVRRTVEQASVARLQRHLERLEEIRREMSALEKDRLDRLKETTPETETDPAKALVSMRKAEEVMKREAEPGDAERSARMDEIDRHLEDAIRELPTHEARFRSVMSEIDRVRSLQDRARQAWTRTTRGEEADELADARRDAEKHARDYEKKLAEADKKDRQVAERRRKLEDEQAKLNALRQDISAETDERKLGRLESKISQQEQRIRDRTRQVDDYEAKATAYRSGLEERADLARSAEAELKSVREDLDGSRNDAIDLQKEAAVAQGQAIARMENALAGIETAEADEPDPASLTPEQAYRAALRREREITETFKTWRAAELAMLREIPLGEALRQTDVVRPERPPLDQTAPDATVGSAAGLEARKEQLNGVLQETGSMVSLAENLLGMSRRQMDQRSQGHAVSLEQERENARSRARLASVDLSGRIADMTTLGSAALGGDTGRGGSGATPSGTGDGQSGTGDNGTGRSGDGTGGISPREARFSSGPGSGFSPPEEVRPGRLDGFVRKITRSGDPAEWMSPNSWYVIGPFANPGRANIDRRFPPESVIDLDASYIGKDDRIIRWEYHTTDRAEVVPRNEEPYGIWYATTEIWSDVARDVWMAMGSDDQGRLWINGQPVWISASKHKDWRIGEALRRVSLTAGRNRLLYRIENGHGGMAFSLCISLGEP